MSKINERILPKEINLDISPLYLGNDKARFIRGIDYALYGDGSEMVYKPEESNKLYDTSFTPPAGDNFAVLRYVSKQTNEVYVGAYNSNGNHFIYRIKDGGCEYVYRGKELGFVLDPLHFIGQGRIEVIVNKIGDEQKTFLIWTDNNDDQHFLCVEDSIDTDSFNDITYPYFKTKYPKREYILLGLRAFTDCIQIKEVPGTNKGINRLKFKSWKFRISGYDVYGRELEHGKISDTYYIADCFGNNIQCLDLTFDVLSPLVDKIAVEFSNDCGLNWKRHALLDKYEPCKGNFWERQLNKILTIVDNKITYRFCPGEQCLAVPSDQTKRAFNPLPNKSNGVIRIQNGIALANNEYGQKPFGCDVMDKIKFSVENPLPEDAASVTVSNRTITIWMAIFNLNRKAVQGIWWNENKTVWGGLSSDGRIEDRVGGAYGQHLGEEDQEGFIGYLSDGSVAISRQYKYKNEMPPLWINLPASNTASADDWQYWGIVYEPNEIRNGFFLQKFEFKNVRPGKYIFRIAGHQSKLSEDYKRTSTYFSGHVKFWGRFPDLSGNTWTDTRELLIDVCEKDYDGMKENQVIEILDLTVPRKKIEVGRETRVSSGYIYEASNADKGINPIAFVPIDMHVGGDAEELWTYHTDYNGFWFASTKDKDHDISAWLMRNCKREKIPLIQWNKDDSSGLRTTTLFATQRFVDYEKEKCNRIAIEGRIVDCEHGAGIAGVTVGLTNGQSTLTDNDGKYRLITYDWERQRNEQQASHIDSLLFLPNGRCSIVNCDGATCIPSIPIVRPSCVNCNDRIVAVPDVKLKLNNKNQRGLQLGGRYPFGVGGGDWMDRKGFVQAKKQWMLDIPTINDMGLWGFPKIKWQIDPDAVFDPWIEQLYFYWGKNVKYTDFHTWVVDRFELIDVTGNVNNVAPTQIRIYYSSLNEYNKQYNFSTNSTWQVVDEKDSLITTDTVHFIANGDYNLFPPNITALVRSDKQGQYFQIDYTTDLKDLKEGALFKLLREPECEETELFYEVCESIPVVNGKVTKNFGYLNVYDSYFLNRQIPTPFVQTKKVKKAVEGSDNPITYTDAEESETINVLRSYGWPFEHHSPSDFWGKRCGNYGRVNSKNDLENIVVKEDQLALSGALGVNGNVNYLHYFDDKNRIKEFGKEYGGIIAALVKGNNVVVICENKTFVSVYDDTTVRIDGSGQAKVLSGERQFSNPQNIILNGCRQADRNAIATDGNIISWVDGSEIGLIIHDYVNGQNVVKGRWESFLRRKIKSIDRSHKADGKINRFLHGEINEKNGAYIFTDFKISDSNYINNSFLPSVEENETVCVDVQSGSLRRFAHYTAEMYASIPGEEQDKQFFAFKNALPYSHYNNSQASLSFFGVQCQPMIRITMATDPLMFKNFLSIVLHCDNINLFAEEVLTYSKQKSWIPRNMFKRVNKYWVAPFLCDEQSVSQEQKKLTNGEKLRAKGIEVLLIGDPDNSDKYFELTAIEINAIKT